MSSHRLRPSFGWSGALLFAGLASLAWGHVRLRNPSNGNALFWSNDEVSVVIQADGSDDIDLDGHVPALQQAIASWNTASGTDLRLVEDTDPDRQASTNWRSDSSSLILFDEDNESGYFPNGSGIVALTPLFFRSSGRITDADVLFNGRSYRFTTSGEAGAYDVADVGAHELGHLLGLDHSCWAGGTMYPYVDTRIILHRSLSMDEVHGLRTMRPSASYGRLTGRLVRETNGDEVSGAHVVLRNANGRSVASVLTRSDGDFNIEGLETGTYQLYATPVEGPVRAINLGETWDIETDFESTLLGSFEVAFSEATEVGDQAVGEDVPVSLGRSTDDLPLQAVQGQVVSVLLRGSNLNAGGTLQSPSSALTLQNVELFGSLVQFQIVTQATAALGHVDLEYRSADGDLTILTGAIEITPPDPTVSLVTPASGSNDGGSPLTIVGTGFRAGARVVIGDQLYSEDDGLVIADSSTIQLTTQQTIGGLHDVVVIDPSGVEGRLVSGFRASAVPIIETIFPAAGNQSGGTLVTLSGDDFVEGATVTIDGVQQTQIEVMGSGDQLVFQTEPGTPAGPVLLTVQNPAGALATIAFEYVEAPDPDLSALSPVSGPSSGGTEVILMGNDFVPGMQVRFGADPITGIGGVEAESVTYLSPNQLQVVTPKTTSGSKAVAVDAPGTGQADLLESAFAFEGSGGGGSGGGCGSIAIQGPPTWPRIGGGLFWLAVAALVTYLVGARERARGWGLTSA